MENELKKYLEEGINYSANTIIKADQGDLEQLASDSFSTGWMECEGLLKEQLSDLKKALEAIKDCANKNCNNFDAYNDHVYLTAKNALDGLLKKSGD